MNENPPKDPAEETGEPVGGARLAAARISHDISARDIAKELHLDEPTVLAIEQNNFRMLGAPVFAKGHLRKYAELVGVPVEDVIADYYQMTRSESLPPVVAPTRKVRRDVAPGPWIGAVLVALAGGAAAWWWFSQPPATTVARPRAATLAPFATDPAPAAEAVADAAPDAGATPADEPPADSAAAEPVAAATTGGEAAATESTPVAATAAPPAIAANDLPDDAALASGAPQVVVELTFSGDCWAEVSDATGRRLFYDLGTAGQVVTLSGEEPFRMVFGDSSNVSMTVAGRAYNVPPTSRTGLTRLTVRSQ